MKNLLIILLFLPLGLLAQSQWRIKFDKAKIKSEVLYNHNPEKDYWYKDYFEVHYDTAGYTTSFYYGNGKHKRRNTIKYTYDNHGRELKIYSKRSIDFNYSYTYDSKNDVTIVRDSNIKSTPIVKILNKKANVDTFFNYNSDYTRKTIFKYNLGRTLWHVTYLNKKGLPEEERIETHDDQDRITEYIHIKNGVRQSHSSTKYEKYGYTYIDSSKFATGPNPPPEIANRVRTDTYRYDKLDKYDRPVVVSQLIDGKYLVVKKVKTKYYE